MSRIYSPVMYPGQYTVPMPMTAPPSYGWNPNAGYYPGQVYNPTPQTLPMPPRQQFFPQQPQPLQAQPVFDTASLTPPAEQKPAASGVDADAAANARRKSRINHGLGALLSIAQFPLAMALPLNSVGGFLAGVTLMASSFIPYLKGNERYRESLKNTTKTSSELSSSGGNKVLGGLASIAGGFVGGLIPHCIEMSKPLAMTLALGGLAVSNMGWIWWGQGRAEKKQAEVAAIKESLGR